jgi:hypothetical protein
MNKFIITEDEKKRILSMHIERSKNQYLNEREGDSMYYNGKCVVNVKAGGIMVNPFNSCFAGGFGKKLEDEFIPSACLVRPDQQFSLIGAEALETKCVSALKRMVSLDPGILRCITNGDYTNGLVKNGAGQSIKQPYCQNAGYDGDMPPKDWNDKPII